MILFLATVLRIFALAFQSQSVNHGYYRWALLGSLALGFLDALVYRHVQFVDSDLVAGAVMGAGGAFGSLGAMWVHINFVRKKEGPNG